MRAFILDDDPLFLAVTEGVLAKLGISDVVARTDGPPALGELCADPDSFDLVVLDLNMPEIDGFACLRALSKSGFKGGVVVVSGERGNLLDSAHSIANRLGLRFLGSLSKPLNGEELSTLLDKARQLESADKRTGSVAESSTGDLEPTLFYQKQVDCRTGRVVSAEALLRARRSDGTFEGPVRLLGQCSEHSARFDLTIRLFSILCADLSKMRTAGVYLPVSFNIDVSVLADVRLVPNLKDILGKSGLDATSVRIEVTENELPEDPSRLIEVIARLALLGFEVSLDDFGVGGSNFQLLREGAFDEVKIDREILQAAMKESTSRIFFQSVMEVSHSMHLRVVAEGVETEAQKIFCIESGVTVMQGFLFSRPVDRNTFTAALLQDRYSVAV